MAPAKTQVGCFRQDLTHFPSQALHRTWAIKAESVLTDYFSYKTKRLILPMHTVIDQPNFHKYEHKK
jgi:hypothetical protein